MKTIAESEKPARELRPAPVKQSTLKYIEKSKWHKPLLYFGFSDEIFRI
jgi:hypothetical protein